MKNRIYFLVFLILVVIMSAVPASAGESMAAAVRLNVRAGPGLDNAVLDILSMGERVLVNQCRNEWCQITHVGIDGWVYMPYLAAATFSRNWRAASRDLPATLDNDDATSLDLDASIGLPPKYR